MSEDASNPQAAAKRVLKELSSFLRNLTEEELGQILDGGAEIAVVPRSPTRPAAKNELPDNVNVDKIRTELLSMSTREEAATYLLKLGLTRTMLQALNAAFDLPVRKSDRVEDLRSNLVEATVGFRLRSSAIREGEAR
ncbi:hypothetical protein AB0N48_09905 [Micromonospora chalcea]|uniref:hypothetical protein n=1 Tax=Micromonospora chalcea TaxID=1874 RepID=UPI003434F786